MPSPPSSSSSGSHQRGTSPSELERAPDFQQPQHSTKTLVFVGLLSLIGLLGYDAYSSRNGGVGSILPSLSFSSSTRITKKGISNFGMQRVGYDRYTYFGDVASKVLTYAILDDQDAIIEPYSEMQLTYYGSDIDDDDQSYYGFSVVDKTTDAVLDSGEYYPTSPRNDKTANVACTPLSDLKIEVTKYSESNKIQQTFNLNAKCLYVRRELRSLTDDDLSKVMDAMYTMWTTADADGQEMYNTDFHSATFFAEMHDFNAAWRDGDHIHEGLGFLPQHIKMTNLFEASMQAVDPSVSLFYWDFTIDDVEGLSIFESPMFTSDTFGSLPKSASEDDGEWYWTTDSIADGYIPDGRWANTKAQRNPFDDLPSAYGYMRGPWCMNPTPKITRFPGSRQPFKLNLPSCRSYVSWIEDDDKMSFLKTAEDNPHAVVHGNIGGVFGCDTLKEMQDQGYLNDNVDDLATTCMKWSFYMKELYRANLLEPRTDCSAKKLTMDKMDCGFVCNDDDAASWIKTFQGFAITKTVPDDLSDEGWEAWRQFACNGNGYLIFTGDQLESASPNDPSFWPIHPTQERLYHAKMMSGGFTEDTWPTTLGSGKAYDWVCNHAKCYDYTGESSKKDFYLSCCQGHFEDDQLLDHAKQDRTQGYGITNRQLFLDTDPTSADYAMTYIYDEFEWAHCGSSSAKSVNAKVLSMSEEKERRARSLRQ